jgi:ribosomal RNA assembly protein
MKNIHPIYHIKVRSLIPLFYRSFAIFTPRLQEMMIRRQLAQDPKLAHEDWSRFLPKFTKRRSNKRGAAGADSDPSGGAAAGASTTTAEPSSSSASAAAAAGEKKSKKEKEKKKVYTPFPPAQQPSKVLFLFPSSICFL